MRKNHAFDCIICKYEHYRQLLAETIVLSVRNIYVTLTLRVRESSNKSKTLFLYSASYLLLKINSFSKHLYLVP